MKLGDGRQILVVDDFMAVIDAIRRALKPRQDSVIAATTKDQACAIIEGRRLIDLALVDMRLGPDRGEDVIARLAEVRSGVPVIAMSGGDENALRSCADEFGHRHVVKGERLDALLRHIDSAMPERRVAAIRHIASRLSPRPAEYLIANLQGIRAFEFAKERGISTRTVQGYRDTIRLDLGVDPEEIASWLRYWYPLPPPPSRPRRRTPRS